MAVIHDMIPDFELYQPENMAGALEVLDRHREKAWVLAGGMDTFDWLKDRVKRPRSSRRPRRHPGVVRDPVRPTAESRSGP